MRGRLREVAKAAELLTSSGLLGGYYETDRAFERP